MLDGLLGRGFSPKCKSLMKATKTRIEGLRRRAEAKQRFLKEDLAKLLANGLDINAFGRTEEFLAGMCLLSCYDFIEYSCEYILKWLSTMQKQRECPEECREPISSLMFAAARFSDLPELRDLRDAFQERYGNSLEYFANRVFVEKLGTNPPTVEKKLQLLQEIASEFSIKWDSKGFEKRMSKPPPAFTQDQPRKYGPPLISEDKYALSGNSNNSSRTTNKLETTSSSTGAGHTSLSSKAENTSVAKVVANEISFRARREFSNEKKHGGWSVKETEESSSSSSMTVKSGTTVKSTLRDDKGIVVPKEERKDPSLSSRKGSSDFVDGGYPMALRGETKDDPLPHGKGYDRVNVNGWLNGETKDPKGEMKDHPLSRRKGTERAHSDRSMSPKREKEDKTPKSYQYKSPLPPPYVKTQDRNINPPYTRPKDNNEHASVDSAESSVDPTPRIHARPVDRRREKETDQDIQNHIPLPKPRSVRKKHHKPSSSLSNHEEVHGEDGRGIVKRTSSRRKEHHSRKGLQILFDDEHYQKDEEERMMDKLLLHYSKKSSNYDITKLRKKSDLKHEIVPTRSISLPHQSTPPPSEGPKVFARASSFHPDGQAPHVHPKLPDYDDLAARFASLRGR